MNDPDLVSISRMDGLTNARKLYQDFCAYVVTRMADWATNEPDPAQAARLAQFDARLLERGALAMTAISADDEPLDPLSSRVLAEYSLTLSSGMANGWDDDEALRFWVGEFPTVLKECLARQDRIASKFS